MEALSFGLVGRVEELGDRYAATLDALDSELKTLEARTSRYLAKMGIK